MNIIDLPKDILNTITKDITDIDTLSSLKKSCKTFNDVVKLEKCDRCKLFPCCRTKKCRQMHYYSSMKSNVNSNIKLASQNIFDFDYTYKNFDILSPSFEE